MDYKGHTRPSQLICKLIRKLIECVFHDLRINSQLESNLMDAIYAFCVNEILKIGPYLRISVTYDYNN